MKVRDAIVPARLKTSERTGYFFLAKQAATNALSVHEFPFFVGTSLSSYVCGLKDPADHPMYPRNTSAFWFKKSSCGHMYFLHESVLPPPVSLRMALRLLALSHV